MFWYGQVPIFWTLRGGLKFLIAKFFKWWRVLISREDTSATN